MIERIAKLRAFVTSDQVMYVASVSVIAVALRQIGRITEERTQRVSELEAVTGRYAATIAEQERTAEGYATEIAERQRELRRLTRDKSAPES